MELCRDPGSANLHKSQTEPILTFRFTNSKFFLFFFFMKSVKID